MAFTDAAGNPLTKSQLLAKTTDVTYPADKKFTETVYQTFTPRNAQDYGKGRRQKFTTNQVVTAAYIDSLYSAGTISSTSPATAATAGGTVVTVNGTGFDGATAATVGGTAVTNFKVVSDKKITFTAPAKTAGSQALVITDDGGNITGTNITYA